MQKLCNVLNISLSELFDGEYKNLEIKNLYKIYETKQEKIVAIDNANYKFEMGKLYAIMGHSGSGKTTLLNILGTLDKQTSGKYLINDTEISNFSEEQLSYIRMKKIGFIFQNYQLDHNLKAFENVMLPMYINNEIKRNERKIKSLKLLDFVGLKDRYNHYPKELSGGEQQRVAIARSLANEPNIIIADEPTGNLDEKNEKLIFEILNKLKNDGKCVIIVTHDKSILKYADNILYMSKGKLGVYNEE